LRKRLYVPTLAYSGALFAVLFAPHMVWALQHLQESTHRMAKLDRANSDFGGIDIPLIGLDGLLALILAIAAWAGPLLIAWFIVRSLSRREDPYFDATQTEDVEALARFFGRAAAAGVAAFAIILLAGDLHFVSERYVTPLLMPLPFWLALAWPLEGRLYAPVRFLRLGAVAALLMVTAWPLWIAFGREHFAYPYRAIAAALRAKDTEPLGILAEKRKFAANLAIKLDHASIWDEGTRPDHVVILWDAKASNQPGALAAELGEGFTPQGEVLSMNFPYDNFSGHKVRLKAQFYARKP
jgi:hypothetical protein